MREAVVIEEIRPGEGRASHQHYKGFTVKSSPYAVPIYPNESLGFFCSPFYCLILLSTIRTSSTPISARLISFSGLKRYLPFSV